MKLIDKIYLINHPDLKDRLNFQIEQFKRLNLQYQKINSVECKNSTLFVNNKVKSLYLSHIHTLKLLSTTGLSLICEDDILIESIDSIDKYLLEVVNSFSSWGMIYFEIPNCPNNSKVSPNIYKTQWQLNTHAYIINSKIVTETIIKLEQHANNIENGFLLNKDAWTKKRMTHIDQTFREIIHPNIEVYAPTSNLIRQGMFGSSLGYKKTS